MTAAVLASTVAPSTASGVFSLTWLLIGLPLLGAAVLLVGGRRTDKIGHLLGTLTAALSAVLGIVLFFALQGRDGESRTVVQHLYSWVPVADFRADAALQLDQLSICFVLLITVVGTLIHVYSIGYMSHDRDRRRFFAYLNLFIAAMLLLVLGNSYLTLYFGWEGVGLASYLLIGFWNYRPEYATAAKKAFVMNRIGDVGLSIAIVLMFSTFGTFSFAGVAQGASQASSTTMTVMGLMLLLAACGKSAQVPLQAWLGDAMAGPTPVSALIHAATMVTAGVYLIVRSAPVFDASATARAVVMAIGAITLLYGAIVGCAKDDIKKALAASTMSQIGYMILAAGLGPAGYAIAIMHLLAHGFFKAGLFLGAGSVMHGMNDQTDMRRFGGLRTVMPVTFVTFGLGYLAIIGLPPFSGFFTKDKIIEAAFNHGGASGWTVGLVALLGAGLTAFYMTRVMVMTFFGPRRWTEDVHPHESGTSMTMPMVVLAIGSVFAGGLFVLGGALQNWLEPVVGTAVEEGASTISPAVATALSLVVVLGGVAAAFTQYARRDVPVVAPAGALLTRAARRDLYQDSVNEAVVMLPGQYLTRSLVFGDNRGIDGAVNGLAAFFGGLSARARRLQTGFVRSYALSMLGGAVVVVAAMLLVRI